MKITTKSELTPSQTQRIVPVRRFKLVAPDVDARPQECIASDATRTRVLRADTQKIRREVRRGGNLPR
jgi:hypothetical protein